ncbi:hypothetical protein MD484_g8248, partial [Candolleomyces efflorescens]
MEGKRITIDISKKMIRLTDISLELEDSTPNHEYQDLDIKLVAFGCWKDGTVSDGIDFSLVHTSISPRKWQVQGLLELNQEASNGITIIATSEEWGDIGFLHVDSSFKSTLPTLASNSNSGQGQRIETTHAGLHLALYWNVVEHEITSVSFTVAYGDTEMLNTVLSKISNVSSMPDPEVGKLQNLLGDWLFASFKKTQDLSVLSEAISA